MNPTQVQDKANIPSIVNGKTVKAFITWTGLQISDPSINPVSLVYAYMQEVTKLTCGECGMGYNGVRVLSGTLGRIVAGQGNEGDIDLLVSLANGIHENAACDFCRQAVKPVMDSAAHFSSAYEDSIKKHLPLPQVDYINNVTSPCMEACPIHQDIPGYIQLTRNRRYNDALEVIRRTNCLPGILGRACVAFCEKNCVRNDIDQPLAIRALKRVPTDFGLTKIGHEKENKREKVAVLGCGPAGLTAAELLARKGYQVYLIDEQAEPGGMAAVGIPPYRLPRRVISAEVDVIKASGLQLKMGTRVPHVEDLMMNVKAVLVTTGAHQSKDAGIKGWDAGVQGCLEGVKYLRLVNAGKAVPQAGKVIIVGGGNTAVDCARAAVRMGSNEVTLVYRRSRVEMPARAEEVEAAEREGVKFFFLALPVKINIENEKVVGAECQRMELGEPDASGRRRPVPVNGSEFVIPADLVLTAIGESPELSFLPKGKVELTEWGSIKSNPAGCTTLPWLFTAGDCASGPATIVEAMAAARRAANSLDRYLNKKKEPEEKPISEALHQVGLSRTRFGPIPATQIRQHPREIQLKERITTFDEVEQCFTPEVASKEAARCLRCYRVMVTVS